MGINFGVFSAVVSIAGLGMVFAQAEASRLICSDPTNNQYVKISTIDGMEREYFNGLIEISGNEVIGWIRQGGFLPDNKVNCSIYYVEQCSMKARVSVQEKTAFQGGRFENSFRVIPDSGGVKLIAYFGNNNPGENERNWWFSSCIETP